MYGMTSCFVKLIIFLLLLKIVVPSGLGKCPKLDYMDDFNVTKFAGRWYEIERSFYPIELLATCVTIDLKLNSKNQLSVAVVSRSTWTGDFTVSEGIASLTKKDPSVFLYKVHTKLPRIIAKHLPGAGYYQVLDTDYNNFAILWTCTNYGLAYADLIWVWGRTKEFNATLRSNIYNLLTHQSIDIERLLLPRNSNCTNDYKF